MEIIDPPRQLGSCSQFSYIGQRMNEKVGLDLVFWSGLFYFARLNFLDLNFSFW